MSEVKMKGKYFVYLYGENGELKDQRLGHNVVTTVGKEFLASFLNSAVAGAATFRAGTLYRQLGEFGLIGG